MDCGEAVAAEDDQLMENLRMMMIRIRSIDIEFFVFQRVRARGRGRDKVLFDDGKERVKREEVRDEARNDRVR